MTVNYNRPQINVNEKLNTNKTNIGQLGRKVLGAQTQEQLSDYVSAGRINQIRNGDATINQRGASSYSSNGYTLDGWFMGTATTYTVTPHTLTVPFKGFNKAIRCQVTGSGNSDPYLLQRIENGHRAFHQQTVTFSFWAAGDVEMALASQGVSFPGGYGTVPFKDLVQIDEFRGGWRRFAVTAGMGDLSGLSYFQIGFELEPSTVFDVYFTGLQCEIGSSASPFQHLPIADQLAWNMRYYQVLELDDMMIMRGATGTTYSLADLQTNIFLSVPMRATPSTGNLAGGTPLTAQGFTNAYSSSPGTFEIALSAKSKHLLVPIYRANDDNGGTALPTSVAFLTFSDDGFVTAEL